MLVLRAVQPAGLPVEGRAVLRAWPQVAESVLQQVEVRILPGEWVLVPVRHWTALPQMHFQGQTVLPAELRPRRSVLRRYLQRLL